MFERDDGAATLNDRAPTMSSEPQHVPEEQVDERQRELARQSGEAYRQSVEYTVSAVAEAGAIVRAGDYLVGVAQEQARGVYRMENNRFRWSEPAVGENCHLAVFVADATDGRFLPHLNVRAMVEDGEGWSVGPRPVPFAWHPGVYHYGETLEVPGDGAYTVTVDVEPPRFPRHGHEDGDRYTDPVEVRFEDLAFTTGRRRGTQRPGSS